MKKNKLSEGFTLTETLVTVIIAASLTGAILAGARGVLRITESIENRTKKNTATILLERTLKREAGRIRIPFWETFQPEIKDGFCAIPWYDGLEDQELKIEFTYHGLEIYTPDENGSVFSNFTEGSIEPLLLKETYAGIKLNLNSDNDVVMPFLFGGFPPIQEDTN